MSRVSDPTSTSVGHVKLGLPTSPRFLTCEEYEYKVEEILAYRKAELKLSIWFDLPLMGLRMTCGYPNENWVTL